jgi:hypothetical protein
MQNYQTIKTAIICPLFGHYLVIIWHIFYMTNLCNMRWQTVFRQKEKNKGKKLWYLK